MEELLTYADYNYFGESNVDVEVAIKRLVVRMENTIRWLTRFVMCNMCNDDQYIDHRRWSKKMPPH